MADATFTLKIFSGTGADRDYSFTTEQEARTYAERMHAFSGIRKVTLEKPGEVEVLLERR